MVLPSHELRQHLVVRHPVNQDGPVGGALTHESQRLGVVPVRVRLTPTTGGKNAQFFFLLIVIVLHGLIRCLVMSAARFQG